MTAGSNSPPETPIAARTIEPATKFYVKHRKAMDEGARAAWESRYYRDEGEASAIQIIAPQRIVQVGGPIHLHRAGDMPGFILGRIDIDFNQPHLVGIIGDPKCRHPQCSVLHDATSARIAVQRLSTVFEKGG